MQTMSRAELERKMATDVRFALVEVLPESEYERAHLPGAMNIPLGDDFEHRVSVALPDKERHIVLYCSDEHCDASPTAARKLEMMGYRNVFDYSAGKEDWADAGLRLNVSP